LLLAVYGHETSVMLKKEKKDELSLGGQLRTLHS